MEKCIFCQIISHQVLSKVIWENESVLVILDTAQDVDYHLLVMPKKHVATLLDCDQDTLLQLILAIQKVGNRCIEKGFSGLNVLSASGTPAGQSVPHLHFHLILRKAGDGIDAWPKFNGSTVSLEDEYSVLKFSDRSENS